MILSIFPQFTYRINQTYYDCHIITVTLRGTAGKSLEKGNFLNFESERALIEVWIQPTVIFKLR
jgi:hypothetical protein